jgi:hypothetical protein
MAISEITGTKEVDTTEWSLADVSTANGEAYSTATPLTDDGVVQVFLDLDDMVAGDQLQVRIYEKCRSGDTQRVVYEAILTGDQGSSLWVSPPLTLMHGWDVTADALAGTITVNWSIRRIPA